MQKPVCWITCSRLNKVLAFSGLRTLMFSLSFWHHYHCSLSLCLFIMLYNDLFYVHSFMPQISQWTSILSDCSHTEIFSLFQKHLRKRLILRKRLRRRKWQMVITACQTGVAVHSALRKVTCWSALDVSWQVIVTSSVRKVITKNTKLSAVSWS